MQQTPPTKVGGNRHTFYLSGHSCASPLPPREFQLAGRHAQLAFRFSGPMRWLSKGTSEWETTLVERQPQFGSVGPVKRELPEIRGLECS